MKESVEELELEASHLAEDAEAAQIREGEGEEEALATFLETAAATVSVQTAQEDAEEEEEEILEGQQEEEEALEAQELQEVQGVEA